VRSTQEVIHNMAKVSKSLSLPVDVAERLEDEDNQSATVERLLREEYDL